MARPLVAIALALVLLGLVPTGAAAGEYPMDAPFFVFATHNPIEQAGTYRLHVALLDRFLFKIEVPYPSLEEEIKILEHKHTLKSQVEEDLVQPFLSPEQIARYQASVKEIIVEQNLLRYIASIVDHTRNNANLYLGASPRASIAILDASKALAAINGRDFVIPDDIKKVLVPVLGHRIIPSPEREMEGLTASAVIGQIVDSIEIPR